MGQITEDKHDWKCTWGACICTTHCAVTGEPIGAPSPYTQGKPIGDSNPRFGKPPMETPLQIVLRRKKEGK